MKAAHLIVVGKLKDKNFESLEHDYLKRIKTPKFTIHEVRARAEDKSLEAVEVMKKVKEISKLDSSFLIALTEFGKEYDSPQFSDWVFKKIESYNNLIFIIAGAEGHGAEVLENINASISLSRLTFPHKMARLVFIEQFYRAITIRNNHPYHN